MRKSSVTLTLGSVHITLSPSTTPVRHQGSSSSLLFVPGDNGDAYTVNLTAFTGTLQVAAVVVPGAGAGAGAGAALENVPSVKSGNGKHPLDATNTAGNNASKRIREELAKAQDEDSEDDDLLPLEKAMGLDLLPTPEPISPMGGNTQTRHSNPDDFGTIPTGAANGACSESPSASSSSSPSTSAKTPTTMGQPEEWSQTQRPMDDTDDVDTDFIDDIVNHALDTVDDPTVVHRRARPARVSEAPLEDDNRGYEPHNNDPAAAGGAVPCPRWGHTLTALDDGARFLVYGGQNLSDHSPQHRLPVTLSDAHLYNYMPDTNCNIDTATATNTTAPSSVWTRPFHCHGLPRQWHTATYLPHRRLLIALGGECLGKAQQKKKNESSNNGASSSSVMVLDTEIMLWYPNTVSGDADPMLHRSGHSATLLSDDKKRNTIVVFGGVRNNRQWLNSIAILDCCAASWQWWQVPPSAIRGSPPPPRSYHSAVALKDDSSRIVIFGGNNQSQCWDSVHVLTHLASAEGSKGGGGDRGQWQWTHPRTNGCRPKGRTGHAAVLLQDGTTIWIHGGWDPNEDDEEGKDEEDDDMVFGDSFFLDTTTWTWTRGPNLPTESKRVGHTAVLLSNSNKMENTSEIGVYGGRIPGDTFTGDFVKLTLQTSRCTLQM